MISEFDRAGLEYHKTFRPPGWKISKSAVQILVSKGFIIAGDNSHYEMFEKKIKHNMWVSYNWDLTDTCNVSSSHVVAYGHTSDWTNNYMNKVRFELIDDLLKKEKFDFRFIEELV